MNKIVRKMATKYWLRFRSTNLQAPASAEAASRRQAKSQTISKFQFRMTGTGFVLEFGHLVIGNYLEFGIWILGFHCLSASGYFSPHQFFSFITKI
jgi:hypothetical protein